MDELPRWISGPKLVAWLDRKIDPGGREQWMHPLAPAPRYKGWLNPSEIRRIRCWERGSDADVYAVDRILVKLGLVLSEVPEEFYCKNYRPRKPKPKPKLKPRKVPRPALDVVQEAAARALRSGLTERAVADRYGVGQAEVRAWASG